MGVSILAIVFTVCSTVCPIS